MAESVPLFCALFLPRDASTAVGAQVGVAHARSLLTLWLVEMAERLVADVSRFLPAVGDFASLASAAEALRHAAVRLTPMAVDVLPAVESVIVSHARSLFQAEVDRIAGGFRAEITSAKWAFAAAIHEQLPGESADASAPDASVRMEGGGPVTPPVSFLRVVPLARAANALVGVLNDARRCLHLIGSKALVGAVQQCVAQLQATALQAHDDDVIGALGTSDGYDDADVAHARDVELDLAGQLATALPGFARAACDALLASDVRAGPHGSEVHSPASSPAPEPVADGEGHA